MSGGPLGKGIAAAEHREVPPGRDETGVGCGCLSLFFPCLPAASRACAFCSSIISELWVLHLHWD